MLVRRACFFKSISIAKSVAFALLFLLDFVVTENGAVSAPIDSAIIFRFVLTETEDASVIDDKHYHRGSYSFVVRRSARVMEYRRTPGQGNEVHQH
jgi:hypothetical protein